MEIENSTYIADTLLYCIFNLNDTLYAVGKDYNESAKNKFKLYHSCDTAHTWIVDSKFETESTDYIGNLYSASRVNQYIFLSYVYFKLINNVPSFYNEHYLLDIYGKKFKEYARSDSGCYKVAFLNDQYIFFDIATTNPSVKRTNDPNQSPDKWEKLLFSRIGTPKIQITESSLLELNGMKTDTLFAFVAYDSLFSSNYLFYARSKRSVGVTEEIKTEEIPKIYIMAPAPIPASDIVRMKIYWDQRYDISQADYMLYNVIGEKMLGREVFTINKLNNYYGELSVNTSGLSSGVYLIAITLGGETRTMPVIISR